ncbi:MAG: ATP-binding protein [Pseudomonadota bacterium]
MKTLSKKKTKQPDQTDPSGNQATEVGIDELIGHPETRLGEMIEGTPSCLKVLDQAGRLLTMNAKGLSMIEAPSMQEVLGADVFSLVAPEDRQSFVDFHNGVCAGESGRLEFRLVGLQGTERLMETWAAPYTLTNGEVAHIAITNDITEHKQNLQLLEAQRHALELASRHAALGVLAGGIAHEINNPLGIISGLAGLMKAKLARSEIDVEDFACKLDQIERTVTRISEVTGSLRTFSSDVPRENRELCDLHQVINQTFTLISEKSKASGIELFNEAATDLCVEINRVQFSQVLMNLLTNSLCAIEGLEARWIRVSTQLLGERVRIVFADSGPGIDQAVVEKLMTPFFTAKAVGEGTGLGLSISLGIMRNLGGTLSYAAESENTTFYIELPLASSDYASNV